MKDISSIKDVSVIITTYNAQDTIKRAILSVLDSINKSKIEIIVVDDCSKDNTKDIVESIVKEHDNIIFIKLKENNGSPSKPRNIGIEKATGQYVTFLDDDDEINVDNLLNMVNYAKMNNLDCIKGYLKVIKGDKVIDMNKIECDNSNNLDVIKNIISKQSTTSDIVLKRTFLIHNNIRFNKEYKLGEDTVFYADIFACSPKIQYYDSYFLYYHKRANVQNLASTQLYQDRELINHIDVWNNVEQKLSTINISYFALRLPIALKNTIGSIIFYSKGKISYKCFLKLSKFVNKNINYLKNLKLHERYEAVFDAIVDSDYEKFLDVSKKRLLIAGYDLKFIKPALKYLNNDYNIKIDEWTSHNTHDEQKSRELLNWADFIFCEWLLGNSVWYSNRKMSHQRLIIRAHKFEATRDFGNKVNYSNVDGVIAVSYYYLELFANAFKIPRKKMILMNNFVEIDIYSGKKTADYKHNIAIVGYIPKWKGLLKGLKILKMLKEHDEKFKLYLMGKNYREVNWVWNDPEERSYFNECENYIKDYNLEDSVIFKGWVERSEMFSNIGYVLSVSDIESFHLAPAEGLCDNTLAFFLDWAGVEYVYPQSIIFDNIDDIKDRILSTCYNENKYDKLLNEMKEYIIKEFDIKKFIVELKFNLEKLALN